MNFQPLFDKVLIKLDEGSDEKTKGGLYIPSSAKTRPNQGTVVAVGPGRVDIATGLFYKMYVKVSDKVLIPEFSGQEVSLPEGTFLLLSQDELFGVFITKVEDKDIPF